jgi:hypothetical protein
MSGKYKSIKNQFFQLIFISYSVFIKKVKHHPSQPVVTPVTVNKEEALQVLKPGQGKVRGHDGLHAFLARNANSDVRRLNHRHIIGTIPC